MLCEILISFVIGILTLWLCRYIYYYQYLKSIPAPKANVWPIIGCGLEFKNVADSLNVFAKHMKLMNTKTLRVHIGFNVLIMTQDYKFIEFLLSSQTIIAKGLAYDFFHPWLGQGLLTSFGENWRKHRKMITPTFHFQILDQFIEVFNSNGTILIENFRKEVGNPSVDVFPYITLCALDIICETAMGTSINAQLEGSNKYAQCVNDMGRIVQVRGFNPLYHRDFIYRWSNLYKEEQAALEVLHGYTTSVIQMRRLKLEEETKKKTQAKSDEVDDLGRKKKVPFLDMLLQTTVDGKPLTDKEIRDEVSTFMFGGHDTTAAGVSFALFNLANNPDCQKKAFEELRDIFGDDKERQCTNKDIQEMKYMELVIKETLRLYPSAPFYTRQGKKNFTFNGVTFPKRMTIGILAYGIHRDPEHFPNPEKFDPDRFLPENYDGKKPFAYIPFSAGPRNCIGQKFAFMEMKTTLSRILRNFELKPATPKHTLQIAADTILKSVNGVKISLEERKY